MYGIPIFGYLFAYEGDFELLCMYKPIMSTISLYILLFICVCCLCGIGIVMRRRGKPERNVVDICDSIREIVSSIDAIIAEGGDERIITRLTAVRAEAEQLFVKLDGARGTAVNGIDLPAEAAADREIIPEVSDVEIPPDTAQRELSPIVEVTGDRMDILDLLDDSLVEKAVKYVEANIQRPDMSVELVSTYLDVSRVYLYKKIKTATGLTPIEFIRLIRLRRAAHILREGGLTVSEVAAKVGFNSPRNFSKYFRDEFGVLPSAYQSQI